MIPFAVGAASGVGLCAVWVTVRSRRRYPAEHRRSRAGVQPAGAGAVRAADGSAGAGEGGGMGALPGPGVVRRYGGER